jgi:hypothetical protein
MFLLAAASFGVRRLDAAYISIANACTIPKLNGEETQLIQL